MSHRSVQYNRTTMADFHISEVKGDLQGVTEIKPRVSAFS